MRVGRQKRAQAPVTVTGTQQIYLKLKTCKHKTGGIQKKKIPFLEVVIVQLEMTFISTCGMHKKAN